MISWAVAAQRSRKIESATIAAPCGLRSSTRTANTNAATKPAPQTVAAASRREAFGQKTATRSSDAHRGGSDSDGESANQSTCGLVDHLRSEPAAPVCAAPRERLA